jgi:hypothetical protein
VHPDHPLPARHALNEVNFCGHAPWMADRCEALSHTQSNVRTRIRAGVSRSSFSPPPCRPKLRRRGLLTRLHLPRRNGIARATLDLLIP